MYQILWQNILNIKNRKEFREWLVNNHCLERECWVWAKRGKPVDDVRLWYLDAVEEALCFGWIDNVCKRVDGLLMQRFAPRRQNGHWTELNKERVRRLEKLGMMTDAGRFVLPKMDINDFKIDEEIETELKNENAWLNFISFPALYQRVRAYNVAFYKKRNYAMYKKALIRLIDETKKGKMFGEWNDYGRLINY